MFRYVLVVAFLATVSAPNANALDDEVASTAEAETATSSDPKAAIETIYAETAEQAAQQWVKALYERRWSDALGRMTESSRNDLILMFAAFTQLPDFEDGSTMLEKYSDGEALAKQLQDLMTARELDREKVDRAVAMIDDVPGLLNAVDAQLTKSQIRIWVVEMRFEGAVHEVGIQPGRKTIGRNSPEYDAVGEINMRTAQGSGSEQFGLRKTSKGWLVHYAN